MENVGRLLSVLALFLFGLSKTFTLEITRLTIPGFVQNGSEESVVLDCEYSYSMKEDENLVVKWFHEDDPSPVYQWIPQMDVKVYSDKYRVIKDFELPSGNAYTRARAIKIQNPTTELSGTYKCQVESHGGADIEEDSMIVYALPSYVTLNYSIADGNVRVVCEVEDVFPLPEVSFFQIEPGEIEETPIDDLEWDYELEDGAYDLEVYTDIPEVNLTSKNGNLRFFGCMVSLNGTDYEKVIKVPYFPNPIAEKQEGDDSDDDSGSMFVSSFYMIAFLSATALFLT